MPLPELIEIVPLDKPVQANITVPGSKSITNRALILAALAQGETTLKGALWSEDTQVMTECLRKLGFSVEVAADPDEFCNRTITVKGLGGIIPNAGTEQKPLELFVGNAGTAARFLSALVCLGKGVYRLAGIPRMNERPKAALFQALRELGYRVESPTDKLPAIIFGTGPKPGAKCTVDIAESSQFASALLLGASVGGWKVKVVGENAEESPYVAMTSKLIAEFPKSGGVFQVDPDASSKSYFWAARWLLRSSDTPPDIDFVMSYIYPEWQIDAHLPKRWQQPEISRKGELGDSIMTAIVIAPLFTDKRRFTNLKPLRLQECERVEALRTELTKCGAKVIEEGDTLTVFPSKLHGAEIETYNDHRIAMCFAVLGLKVPGIKLRNSACVKKTFPNFFQKLAAAPPSGLGAVIRDAQTGRELRGEELFAE